MANKTIKTSAQMVDVLEENDITKGLVWEEIAKIHSDFLQVLQDEGVEDTIISKNKKEIPILNWNGYQFTLKTKLSEVTKLLMHTFEPPKGASWESFNAAALG